MYLDAEVAADDNGNDLNGWNTRWTSACGSTVAASSVSSSLDFDVLLGFVSYLDNNGSWHKGIYAAGGSAAGSYSGIFGSNTISSTSEWTFENETSTVTNNFPSGFMTPDNTTATWFGSAPSNCDGLWQWSGGGGITNAYSSDYDQVHSTVLSSCV